MESYTVKYHPKVVTSDIPGIDIFSTKKIKKAIEDKLTTNPHIFGIPLRSELSGFKKLRVGDYRVVFSVEDNIVFIYMIQHRKSVYKDVLNRI